MAFPARPGPLTRAWQVAWDAVKLPHVDPATPHLRSLPTAGTAAARGVALPSFPQVEGEGRIASVPDDTPRVWLGARHQAGR